MIEADYITSSSAQQTFTNTHTHTRILQTASREWQDPVAGYPTDLPLSRGSWSSKSVTNTLPSNDAPDDDDDDFGYPKPKPEKDVDKVKDGDGEMETKPKTSTPATATAAAAAKTTSPTPTDLHS